MISVGSIGNLTLESDQDQNVVAQWTLDAPSICTYNILIDSVVIDQISGNVYNISADNFVACKVQLIEIVALNSQGIEFDRVHDTYETGKLCNSKLL